MNKTKLIALLVLTAGIAFAGVPFDVTANVGYTSKLLEQGVVTETNVATAGASTSLYGVGVGVETYSNIDTANLNKTTVKAGLFKRVDVTASYKFVATIADLELGATYKNVSRTAAFDGFKNNTVPFIRVSGNSTIIPLDLTARFDTKNHSVNYEGTTKVRIPVYKGFKVVPSFGVGFNDPGSFTVAAYKNAKRYYTGGLGVGYVTKHGDLGAGVFVHRNGFTNNNGQITGYSGGYSLKF
jgi:hypothetical protein